MTDQSDRKPSVSVGFMVIPIVTANFHTGDGQNTVCDSILQMSSMVIGSVTEKLSVAIKSYCEKLGVEVSDIPDDLVKKLVIQSLTTEPDGDITTGVRSGIIDEHGKVIIDDDALKTFASGGSTNN